MDTDENKTDFNPLWWKLEKLLRKNVKSWELDEYITIIWGFFQKRKVVKGELMDSHENNLQDSRTLSWTLEKLLQNEKENALQMDFNIGNIVCRF